MGVRLHPPRLEDRVPLAADIHHYPPSPDTRINPRSEYQPRGNGRQLPTKLPPQGICGEGAAGVHHEFMGRWVAPLRQPPPSPGLSLPPVKSEQGPPFPKGRSQLRGGPALKHPVVRSKSPALRQRGSLDARLSAPTPKPPGRPEPAGVASRLGGPSWSRVARARRERGPRTQAPGRAPRAPARNLGGALAARSARPGRAVLPSDPARPAFPASRPRYGKRRGPAAPGVGSRERGAGRRAEVSAAAAAGPAVVGCARAGRALVGCGPRGWAARSGPGVGARAPAGLCAAVLASALLQADGELRRRAAGRARPRVGPRGARRGRAQRRRAGRAAAPRGGERPMDPRGPAPQTLRRRARAQEVGLGRGATTRTGRRRGAAAAGARGRRDPAGAP
ncbi:hypothetical protein R6Z07F_015923 [Ovis aries]